MKTRILTLGLVVASLAFASAAAADEVTLVSGVSGVSRGGTYTMREQVIYGRVLRPSVVIELSRAKAEIKLADLNSPSVEKILRAGAKDPF